MRDVPRWPAMTSSWAMAPGMRYACLLKPCRDGRDPGQWPMNKVEASIDEASIGINMLRKRCREEATPSRYRSQNKKMRAQKPKRAWQS